MIVYFTHFLCPCVKSMDAAVDICTGCIFTKDVNTFIINIVNTMMDPGDVIIWEHFDFMFSILENMDEENRMVKSKPNQSIVSYL